MTPAQLLFLGVKAHVIAIDKSTGAEIWRTQLKGGLASGDRFVTLLIEDGWVFAHTKGELFCLDAGTGAIRWQNPLPGLSYDLASIATSSSHSAPAAALHHKQMQAAAANSGTNSA